VDIYAGQNIKVGTATFSAPDTNGNVTITIDLNNGAAFADVEENSRSRDTQMYLLKIIRPPVSLPHIRVRSLVAALQ
jgi:hypothetical protein